MGDWAPEFGLSNGLDRMIGGRGVVIHSSGAKQGIDEFHDSLNLLDGKKEYSDEIDINPLWHSELEYFKSLRLVINAYDGTINKLDTNWMKEVFQKRVGFFEEANKVARASNTVGHTSEVQADYTKKVLQAMDDDARPVTGFIAEEVKKSVLREIAELQFLDWAVGNDGAVQTELEHHFSKPMAEIHSDEPFKWILGSNKDRMKRLWDTTDTPVQKKANTFLNKFGEVFDQSVKVAEV